MFDLYLNRNQNHRYSTASSSWTCHVPYTLTKYKSGIDTLRTKAARIHVRDHVNVACLHCRQGCTVAAEVMIAEEQLVRYNLSHQNLSTVGLHRGASLLVVQTCIATTKRNNRALHAYAALALPAAVRLASSPAVPPLLPE